MDLVPQLHAQIQAPQRAIRARFFEGAKRRLLLPWSLAVASVGLAAMALLVLVPMDATSPSGDDQLRAKSAGSPADRAKDWVRLEVYRVRGDGNPERVHDRLGADDGLLFAYANPGPQPFSHLLVFAVDGSGEIFWFYPPHVNKGANPYAIAIRRSRLGTELPDMVEHDLAPGPLAIYGVFANSPIDVASVESTVRGLVREGTWSAESPPHLPLAQRTVQRTITVSVHGREPH